MQPGMGSSNKAKEIDDGQTFEDSDEHQATSCMMISDINLHGCKWCLLIQIMRMTEVIEGLYERSSRDLYPSAFTRESATINRRVFFGVENLKVLKAQELVILDLDLTSPCSNLKAALMEAVEEGISSRVWTSSIIRGSIPQTCITTTSVKSLQYVDTSAGRLVKIRIRPSICRLQQSRRLD